MKKLIFLFYVLIFQQTFSQKENGKDFINPYFDLLGETVQIKPGYDYSFSTFTIHYSVYIHQSEKKVLLMLFPDFKRTNFKLTFDGKEITVKSDPQKLIHGEFSGKFSSIKIGNEQYYSIKGGAYPFQISKTDIHHYETNVSKGFHTISLTYQNKNELDYKKIVKEYTVYYDLKHALAFDLFNGFDIYIDKDRISLSDNPSHWHISKGQDSGFMLRFTPKLSLLMAGITQINPLLVYFGIFLLLILVHIKSIKYIKTNNKWGIIEIIGGILLPFISAFFLTFFYKIIFLLLGNLGTNNLYDFDIIFSTSLFVVPLHVI